MATIDDLLGSPDFLRQLIGEEQFGKARQSALNQGILQASLAALGGRGTAGQVLSQAGTAGLQGYQGSFDRTLSDLAKGMQMQELVRKQNEAKELKNLYASATTPQYTYGAGQEGPTRDLTGVSFDLNKVAPVLAGMGRFDELANIEKGLPLLGGATMKMSDVPSQVKEAVSVLGIKDEGGRLKTPDRFTDEDRTRVQGYIEKSDINKSPKVNTADPTAVAQAAAGNVKDFNTQVKDYREVSRRYNAMVGAAKDKENPATDSTLIYGLAKIYDPSGAVQQGDIATIKGSRSIPQSVVGLADRVSRGGSLTEQERNNIMSTAYSMVNSYSKNVQSDVDTYKSFAKSFGADPNQIKSPFENMEKPDFLYFTIGNRQVKGTKGKDGAYYVQQGNKFYKVSD